MTHEFYEDEYQSDVIQDMLKWLDILEPSEWTREDLIEIIKIKLKEYK